ncbi:PEP-CTERM sorting domain-containing protein [Nodularia chucula]|uniref:PEP-CTERM sorting domain-containing protein n=1 Tax=Nodularia chucula TaxID=3093667 RepID=UPI0039C5DB96
MKNTIKIVSILACSGSLISIPVQAADLDFNNGNSSWSKFGDVYVVDSKEVLLSTDAILDDDFQLGAISGQFNFSGQPAGEVGFVSPNLAEFLGIDVGLLDINGFAYEGSAIKRTIDVKAGDSLIFQRNFLTNENSALVSGSFRGSLNDYSFLLVNDQIKKLADINDATQSLANFIVAFDKETGTQTFKHTFNQAGTYTVGFGVVDIDDFTISSALSIQNVTLESSPISETIPEPTTILGAFVTLGFGVLSRKNQGMKTNKN